MKSVDEIERDSTFKILDEKQEQILLASMKPGVVCSDFVEEWNECQKLREELKKKTI